MANIENLEKTTIRVNPKIYPLSIVYKAAYILMDKAYILLDGDPEKEITAEIRSKNGKDSAEVLAQEFNEQLLNYSVHKVQLEETRKMRELLLERALITNNPDYFAKKSSKSVPVESELTEEEKKEMEKIGKMWEENESDK